MRKQRANAAHVKAPKVAEFAWIWSEGEAGGELGSGEALLALEGELDDLPSLLERCLFSRIKKNRWREQ